VERASLVSLIAKRYYIVSVLFGLSNRMIMMIWNLRLLLLKHLFPMYTTVSLMVVDTQDALAVRKLAFPALRRSL